MEKDKNDYSPNEKPKIEIEINKYKRVVDVLNNPKMLAKAIVVLAVIIVLVFVGVSAIALVIKRFYPYKAIETNKYGATVIKNEDTEVTYWLFNSADLWANSGIEVEKGQRITVRTSGAFHSAIHHLVEDANKNQQRDKWLTATGGLQSSNPHDEARSKFKIANYAFNTVIMQVVPKELLNEEADWFKHVENPLYWDYIDGGDGRFAKANIYRIGEGYEHIEIQEKGVLCFACNDIALTHRKIEVMQDSVKLKIKDNHSVDNSELKVGHYPPLDINKKNIDTDIDLLYNYVNKNKNPIQKRCIDKCLKDDVDQLESNLDSLAQYMKVNKNFKNDNSFNVLLEATNSLIKLTLTELDYYDIYNFIDAWFVDNVGSFLIVVEREK